MSRWDGTVWMFWVWGRKGNREKSVCLETLNLTDKFLFNRSACASVGFTASVVPIGTTGGYRRWVSTILTLIKTFSMVIMK